MANDKIDDFIQQAVNKGYEESMKRAMKKIQYKRERYNEKVNKIRKARKVERRNKRNGRSRKV